MLSCALEKAADFSYEGMTLPGADICGLLSLLSFFWPPWDLVDLVVTWQLGMWIGRGPGLGETAPQQKVKSIIRVICLFLVPSLCFPRLFLLARMIGWGRGRVEGVASWLEHLLPYFLALPFIHHSQTSLQEASGDDFPVGDDGQMKKPRQLPFSLFPVILLCCFPTISLWNLLFYL